MRSYLPTILALFLVLGLFAGSSAVYAQRTSGSAGLGGQIGEPTGVTLKIYNAGGPSYDFLAAWDLDDFFFLNAHALFEDDLNTPEIDPHLEWYVGPGGFIGITDHGEHDDEAVLGISGALGLNLVFSNQVEVYGQLTPRINLVPNTDGDFGGGVGLRYYF